MVRARPGIPGPDDHQIRVILALLNAKSEATFTGWLLSPERDLELSHICGAKCFHIELWARLVNSALAHFWGTWPE